MSAPIFARAWWAVAAVAAVAVLLASCAHASVNDPIDAPSALLVVGRAADLTDGDQRLERHLRAALAVRVTVVDADEDPDLENVDLIVVAPSTDEDAVGARYRDLPVPVIALSHSVWDGMRLADGSADADDQTHVVVLDDGSPVVDDLAAGRHRFLTRRTALHQVVGLAEGGAPVLAAGDDEDAVVLFTFDAGAPLADGEAPARRVGFGTSDTAIDRWLAPAWDLFDASVAWALGHDAVAFDRSALVVVGDHELNASEVALRSRLRRLGFDVDVVLDEDLEASRGDAYELVVMSKTVHSHDVGTKLRGTDAGVVFWEDNQQQLAMMATIDNDASGSTSWHSTRTDVYVDAEALSDLTAGFAGTLGFYVEPDEVCWAPAGELAGDAIPVARVGNGGGDDRYVVYAYEAGGRLADGSRAAGRRVFFGLYDDSFRHLTLEGVRLFDTTVAWAARAAR